MTANEFFALSDRVAALSKRFRAHRGGPVTMNADGVEWMAGELAEILRLARARENEISRLRWNRIGDPDPERVAAAMAAPQSNVVALVIPRPFDDGRPGDGGRAA